MAKLDVTLEEIKALGVINAVFEKAVFPLIEGSEVQNLATSRARLTGLRFKLDKYLKDLNEETAKEIEKKAAPEAPKDPIKKDK